MANLGANFRANVGTAMIAAALAAVMAGSQALAADGSLAPGKPAGIREAAREAYEESGVRGKIGVRPIGNFTYKKAAGDTGAAGAYLA